LHRLLTEIPELRVLRHATNAGQSSALLTGVRAARAAWVVTLDGDGQNMPSDVWTLLRARDADKHLPPALLAGRRQRREDQWLRRLSSWVANGVRRSLLRDDTPDTGCGLKLFQRDVFLALPHFDHMHRFLPALVQRAGGRVVTVPVGHRARYFGRSKYGLFDRLWPGVVDLLGVMWLRRRQCSVASEEWRR
jgi:dolichol-phosphate mannosyltransferase